MRQVGLFALPDHLKRLSAHRDPLEELSRIIDFDGFRPTLAAALAYGDGTKGGRPPYDPVAMLKVLVPAAQNNVSDARMEYLIRDRLSWLRFLGFDLRAATPDANTIRLFREKLTEVGALDGVFTDFDRQLEERGCLAMGGQIVDATLVNVRSLDKGPHLLVSAIGLPLMSETERRRFNSSTLKIGMPKGSRLYGEEFALSDRRVTRQCVTIQHTSTGLDSNRRLKSSAVIRVGAIFSEEVDVLEISQQAHDKFLANSAVSFDLTCDRFVHEHFPELCAMSPPETMQEATDNAVASAERAGFVREPDTLQFVYLWFLLGRDFDVNPQYRWLIYILSNRSVPPSTRLEQVVELVARRMESGQPLAESGNPVDASVAVAALRANSR